MLTSINKQRKIWSAMSFPAEGVHFVSHLYQRYQDDLRRVKKIQQDFNRNVIGLTPQLGDMEAEITYLLLRHYKPATVVEISPASGWSTSWILHALKDNGTGMLHSYDIVDDSVKNIPADLSAGRWSFHKGDITHNMHLLPSDIDYLFIDSDHSARFAIWYVNNIFPMCTTGTNVSIHDILKLPSEPGWGEESLVLCTWLAEKAIPCMTASRALKDKGYSHLLRIRADLDLVTILAADYNSMVFFSLPKMP